MTVLYTIGAICGCLAAIGTIFWGLWSFVRKIVHIVDALDKMRVPVQELRPNGGSSVKDKTDASYELLVGFDERLKKIEEHYNGTP